MDPCAIYPPSTAFPLLPPERNEATRTAPTTTPDRFRCFWRQSAIVCICYFPHTPTIGTCVCGGVRTNYDVALQPLLQRSLTHPSAGMRIRGQVPQPGLASPTRAQYSLATPIQKRCSAQDRTSSFIALGRCPLLSTAAVNSDTSLGGLGIGGIATPQPPEPPKPAAT